MTHRFRPAHTGPDARSVTALCVAVRRGEVLLLEDGATLRLVTLANLAHEGIRVEEARYLGALDGLDCYAAVLDEGVAAPPGMAFLSLRAAMLSLEEEAARVAGLGVQVAEWERTHRFCGACGEATEDVLGERARRCPACGLWAYPRVAPAVIVRITRGEEILLAHGRRFREPMYSVLAGFVEPGESLEEAVHREVAEESGIEIDRLAYFGSQPWPFPHSLMVGFTAEYAAGELRIDESELVDAAWFPRDALPPVPPPLSIARRLIDDFAAPPPR